MSSLFVIQGITCSVFYLQQKGQEQLFKKTFCGMFADQKICKECNHRWEINLLFSLRVVSQLLVNNLEVGQIFWDYHVTHNRDLSHNTDQSDYQKRKTWILCLLNWVPSTDWHNWIKWNQKSFTMIWPVKLFKRIR